MFKKSDFDTKRFLFFDGHRYLKDHEKDNVIYWRCSGYYLNNCRARATTKMVNGQERVKINDKNHNHEP